ncbi:hypothetical protein [Pelagibacterium halotolerans]|uniref:hypothetical protein n=1 Tax=Pelagibacterium halotolerans TaxID=531813 RepID=UPI00384E1A17
MRCLSVAFAAAAMLCGVSGPATAGDLFVPAVSFPASRTSVPDRAIDVLGLVPGLSVEEARAALAAIHDPGAITEHTTAFTIGARGVSVQTEEFLGTMEAGRSDDRIEIFFAGPAAENQSFAVERVVRYPQVLTAPTVAAIAEALIAKYGTPSYNSRDFRETVSPEMVWSFAGEAQISCMGFGGYGSGQGCPVAWTLLEYAPHRLDAIAREPLGFDLVIVAKLETHREDRTKVAGFTVTVSDLLRRKRAAAADTAAMVAELERVHAEASNPVSAPAL